MLEHEQEYLSAKIRTYLLMAGVGDMTSSPSTISVRPESSGQSLMSSQVSFFAATLIVLLIGF